MPRKFLANIGSEASNLALQQSSTLGFTRNTQLPLNLGVPPIASPARISLDVSFRGTREKPREMPRTPSLPQLPRHSLRREDLKPDDCLCDHCTGKCCRYFSLPIDKPTTWDDFDAIRWYLTHGQTTIYVDDDTWYLAVLADCKYLTADFRCGIYHDRPKVCREYTTENCEYDSDWKVDKLFESPEQLWEYAEAVLPPRRKPVQPPPHDLIPVSALTAKRPR